MQVREFRSSVEKRNIELENELERTQQQLRERNTQVLHCYRIASTRFVYGRCGSSGWIRLIKQKKNQIFIILPVLRQTCNEWRDPSPQRSVRVTQLRRNIAAVAALSDVTGPVIQPKTFSVDSVVFTTSPIHICVR